MEITGDMITQYGLMQKISTGNGIFDMILVMLVPILIRSALPLLTNFVQGWLNPSDKLKHSFRREIVYNRNSNYWWSCDGEGPSNQILQKALLTHINTYAEVIRKLDVADYTLRKITLHDLSNGQEKPLVEEDEAVAETINEHAYGVNAAPPIGSWIDLKNGIRFMRQQENIDEKGKNTKITYFLESELTDGNTKIDSFVNEALELYRKQQSAKVDLSRYMYVPVLTGWQVRAPEGESKKPSAIYKRYKLSEEKTFASFFHPEKEGILQLVNHFLHKTGKFGIAGYPNKLGLLLYGPPGTGKTSFIKALAQYTKRSIISIPLTKIQTNQTLMDLMMDQRVEIDDGESSTHILPFSKTIFVMEDVDAAGTVVHRRAPQVTTMTNLEIIPSQEGPPHAKREGVEEGEGREEGPSLDESESKKKPIGPALMGMGKGLWGGDDDLNLAGLLNVLDGVVDTPNRLIIMTTNHPEKLDPALIRPGRINKKIYMGRIKSSDAVRMLKHYFGTVSEECVARLHNVFVDDVVSPAELEAMCAEFETVEALVEELDRKFTAKFGPALIGTSGTDAATTAQVALATPSSAADTLTSLALATGSTAAPVAVPLPLASVGSVPPPCP